MSAQIRNLDNVIVALIAGPLAAGQYGLAGRLVNPLKLLPDTLGMVLLPAISRSGLPEIRKLILPLAGMMSFFVVLFGSVAAFAPVFVPILVGDAYTDGIYCLQILAAGLVFASFGSLLSSILLGTGASRAVSLVALLSGLFCVIGALVGSFMGGAVGASILVALSFLVQCSLLFAIAHRMVSRGDMASARPRVSEATSVALVR